MRYYNNDILPSMDSECEIDLFRNNKTHEIMRNFTLTILFMGVAAASNAQALDTLFYEDFNTWENVEIEDSIFTDYDEDGLVAANGLPGGWFVANLANGGADSLEMVALSASWLEGFAYGNRNWLMLPPFDLADTAATLSWRSAPAVGDLYMDGYTVLISNNEWFYYDITLADTLMHFAQNINDVETEFSDGVVHTELDYAVPLNLTPTTQYPGLLAPWSVDLTPYSNQTVYIGFLHNSDDDNFIALDDILVMGMEGSTDPDPDPDPQVGVDEHVKVGFELYPMLVKEDLHISLQSRANCLTITSALGAQVWGEKNISNEHQLNLNHLAPGVYLVRVWNEQGVFTNKFIKQ